MELIAKVLVEVALSKGWIQAPPPVVITQTVTQSLMETVKATASEVTGMLASVVGERTKLEVAMISSSVAWAVWKARREGAFDACLAWSPTMVPGAAYLRRVMGKHKLVQPLVGKEITLESRRADSNEANMTPPKYQARVGDWDVNGDFRVDGCCVRMGNYLVGPDHVIGGDSKVNPRWVYGTQSYVALADKERIMLDTDLVAILMTEKELSTIGIADMGRPRELQTRGSFASITGPLSKGTAAALLHDHSVFGRVVYKGTTLPGYSGAAYNVQNGCVAIHQCGGQINGGYSAQYIQNLLNAYQRVKPESNEWLERQFEAGVEMWWEHTGNPDLVQVRVNGRYSLVDSDDMDKLFGDRWTDDHKITRRKRIEYDDGVEQILESVRSSASALQIPGEVKPVATSSGVSAGLDNPDVSAQLNAQRLTEAYSMLSKAQKVAFRKSIGLSTEPLSIMGSQASESKPKK